MANDRMTPVAAAKELGIRPQMVYGLIKHSRITTFPNPVGKTDLVSLSDVKAATQSVKHHRPKGEDGKPVRKVPGVGRGSLLSQHANIKGVRRNPKHMLGVVTEIVKDEEDNVSLVRIATGDGTLPMLWEAERLADRIKAGACQIESPAAVLGVLMSSWVQSGRPDLSAALQMWCDVNEVEYAQV